MVDTFKQMEVGVIDSTEGMKTHHIEKKKNLVTMC